MMFLDSCEELSNHYNNVRLYYAGGQIEQQRSGNIQRARPKTGKGKGFE